LDFLNAVFINGLYKFSLVLTITGFLL